MSTSKLKANEKIKLRIGGIGDAGRYGDGQPFLTCYVGPLRKVLLTIDEDFNYSSITDDIDAGEKISNEDIIERFKEDLVSDDGGGFNEFCYIEFVGRNKRENIVILEKQEVEEEIIVVT